LYRSGTARFVSVTGAMLSKVKPKPGPRDRVGRSGERAAWAAYRRRGYRLLARNWRCPLGELDLVLAESNTVVFCEVKARTSTILGGPHEAVSASKQQRLRALAEAFIKSRGLGARAYRFDVASVLLRPGGRTDVHLFEDAF
jgi:putative endonuclease